MTSDYMDFQIKKLEATDLESFENLILTFGEVFEMETPSAPQPDYLRSLLAQKSFFAFGAFAGQELAGGVTGYLLPQYYVESPLAYIYDLAVRKEFQRKGIGRGLIDAVQAYCRTENIEQLFVQADDTDEYALEFYHASGAERGKAVNFYYHLRP